MNKNQNDQLLLSIIIPLYNSSKYIQNTISAILNAEEINNSLEIILVDDGSKDSTQNICQNIINENPDFSIKYYKKDNGGIASARNYGISKSSGKYLFFHDHDDVIESSNLPTILDILNNHSFDLIILEADKIINGKNEPYRIVYNNFNSLDLTHVQDELFLTMFDLNKKKLITNYYGTIWSVIVKREFVINNAISFIFFRDYEDDFLFLFDVLLHNPTIGVYKIKIYNWVNNINSVSHTTFCDLSKSKGIEQFASYIKEKLEDTKYDYLAQSIYNGILFSNYYDMVLAYYQMNKKVKYKEAKIYCYNQNVRSRMILPIKKRINYKKRIIRFLYKIKMYRICHLIEKLYFR